ncbi:glycosyltransferase family 4 protein [Anabaena sp. CCY 9402-a]|uniref:glycosyltransferase family 4 protein n=1 Tax=Anabaena sp. CCY 9402-a TaxID=3103867 RepID=UPI0039C660B9
MKILHLSTNDIDGGAARGAYWLHQALIKAGADSTMLVAQKKSNDFTVIGAESKIQKGINLCKPTIDSIPTLFYKDRINTTFSPSWLSTNTNNQIKKINPDIINLHWICGGFLNPQSFNTFGKPIVWTLRDQWGFTGGCHYSGTCEKYTLNCGACPQLGSNQENDISRHLWQSKQKNWVHLDITIVAISQWLAECAKKSSLFKNKRIEVIPNALDELKFKTINKKTAREILNLPLDKKIILFGAINAVIDERKGYQYLIQALRSLSNKGFNEISEIVVFGSSQPKEALDLGMKANYLGRLHDDTTLALTYAAADVTVTPSIEEAFGKTAMESLACGTPVVSFDSTGLKDIVEHQHNGYRAKCFSSDDLANGIAWVIEDQERHQKLCDNARDTVINKFTLELQAKKYLSVYQEIVEVNLLKNQQLNYHKCLH